jgi:hypothetical protein
MRPPHWMRGPALKMLSMWNCRPVDSVDTEARPMAMIQKADVRTASAYVQFSSAKTGGPDDLPPEGTKDPSSNRPKSSNWRHKRIRPTGGVITATIVPSAMYLDCPPRRPVRACTGDRKATLPSNEDTTPALHRIVPRRGPHFWLRTSVPTIPRLSCPNCE